MTFPVLTVEALMGAGPFDVADDFYLLVSGVGDATTPDTAVLDITGDIHVRAEATLDDWQPPDASQFVSTFAGKYVESGDQRSWWFGVTNAQNPNGSGRLFLQWSTAGTAATTTVRYSFVVIPRDSGRLAVGVRLDVDDGGDNTVTFETAPEMAGPWTDLATETQSGTTSIFASTAALKAGNINTGARPLGGRLHKLEVRDGITLVADPDFGAETPGTGSFVDSSGLTWTVTAPAAIVGFTHTDLSDRMLAASWTVGRSNELAQFEPGTGDLELTNEDRALDPEHTTGPHFGLLNPCVPFRVRSSSVSLDLGGVVGATASTPDHASLAFTDMDVRIRVAMDDWTPGGFGQRIVDQDGGAGQVGWVVSMPPGGTPTFVFTTDGTTPLTRTATAATGFTDGSDHWLRVTLDADDGAGNHDVTFYTSDDGASWVQLGAVVETAGTVTPFDSTAPIRVGGAVIELAGQVRSLELRDGIDGTVVADPDFTAQPVGAASFVDSTGKTWTVNGAAAIGLDGNVLWDQFHGFVADGWEQDYRPPSDARCMVKLVDLLDILDGLTLPQAAHDAEVLRLGVRAYWQLDESDGTQMADSSGNGFHGTYDNGEHVEGLVVGAGGAFFAPHVGDNRGIFKGEGLPTAPPCSIAAWVKTPRDLAATKVIANVQRDNARGSFVALAIETSAGGSPNGEATLQFGGLGGYKFRGDTRIDDDQAHQVVAVIAGTATADIDLYVDGQLQAKTTITAGTGGSWFGHLWWTVANTADITGGDFGVDGVVDEASVFDRALTAEEVADLYEAGTTAFDGERTGARINRALDIVGVPDSLRDIADGDTTVGPAEYGSRSAAQYIAAVVESEQGYWHVAHHDGGKLKFRGRYARLTETRSTTAQAAYSDEPVADRLRYERRGLLVDPNGRRSLVNVVKVGWRGGTESVQDAASVAAFGPQSRTISTEAPTPAAAQSAGGWLIARYGSPQVRVRAFETRPDVDDSLWTAALSSRISDRVSFRRHPQLVGAAVSNELTLEQVEHSVQGVTWRTGYRTSNADDTAVWVWGLSTWGETCVWG